MDALASRLSADPLAVSQRTKSIPQCARGSPRPPRWPTNGGGVVVEALGVLHKEVDEQEEEHEGGGSQVEQRHHPGWQWW